MSTRDFSVRVEIDQYTEVPLLYREKVDEELTWMRSWASWRNIRLKGLPIVHATTVEEERFKRTSMLALYLKIAATSLENAVEACYKEVSFKLNLLSVLTNRGFNIMSIGLPHTSNKRGFIRKIHDRYFRYYWMLFREASYEAGPNGSLEGEIKAGERRIGTLETSGCLHEEFELIADIRDKSFNIIWGAVPIKETEERWDSMMAFTDRLKNMDRISSSLRLYRTSRLIRDIYSRYLIVWAALDSFTGCTEKWGKKKIRCMFHFIGSIPELGEKLYDELNKLYKTRNNIAHSKWQDTTFPNECKRDLKELEWIFCCAIMKHLDLPTLPRIHTSFE